MSLELGPLFSDGAALGLLLGRACLDRRGSLRKLSLAARRLLGAFGELAGLAFQTRRRDRLHLLGLLELPPGRLQLGVSGLQLALSLGERLLPRRRRSGALVERGSALLELVPGVVQRLALRQPAPRVEQLLALRAHRLPALDQAALEVLQLLAMLVVKLLVPA